MLRSPARVVALSALALVAGIASPPANVGAQSAGSVAASTRGVLIGTVLDDATNRRVPNADIAIAALNLKVRSDSAGDFTLPDIPEGLYTITITAEGFAPFSTRLGFSAGQRIESDFGLLRPAAPAGLFKLPGTTPPPVKGPMAAFEERRARGAGRFVTQDMLDDARGRKLADVIKQNIPGLMIVSNNGARSAATSSRGMQSFTATPGAAGTKKECYAQVIVDGVVLYASSRGDPLFNLDNIDVGAVAGVEFYTVSQTPSQFNGTGTAPCGTLLIWSKR